MYNFYESFEKMKFQDWIFLRFNIYSIFLWTIKGNKKKKLFSQAVFFLYTFLLNFIKNYTIVLGYNSIV